MKVRQKSKQIVIVFADRSAAFVNKQSVEIVRDGDEAQKFEADYVAAVGAQSSDWDKEEDLGETPEF